LVLVTDAVPALGLPDGIYHMGVNKIVVKNKRATNAGTETLCGSIASLAECVQNMRQALLDGETKNTNEIDKNKFIVESIEAATLHPALGTFLFFSSFIDQSNEFLVHLVLGIEKQKGTLSFGADADFILLDAQLNVLSTFIAGEQAWKANDQWSIDNLRRN
jgi:N-acetylglucosamine-6-phosphate deacetylase